MKLTSNLQKAYKPLFVSIFILMHYLVLNNLALLSEDMIYGDGAAADLSPTPLYDFMRVPANGWTAKYEAIDRLGSDFGQIFFPSQQMETLTAAYTDPSLDPWNRSFDPWGRASRYAPLLHAICSFSLCNLKYGYASLLHVLGQLLIFYLTFFYAFKILQIEKGFFPAILLVNFCLFLTPTGLSWFERGQFSLYVALSYLWLMLGLIRHNKFYVFISALFAYVKWTSFPMMFVVLMIWLLNSKHLKDLKKNLYLIIVFPLTIISLFILHLEFGIAFLEGLFEQELTASPAGPSLVRVFPVFVVKALPFILIVVGYMNIRKHKNQFNCMIPYVVGSGVILNIYPTIAYEYSVPTLLCFIPLIIYWSKPLKSDAHIVGHAIEYLFYFFLLLASFSIHIREHFDSYSILIYGYVLFAALLMLLPVFHSSAVHRKVQFDGNGGCGRNQTTETSV